MDIQVHAHHVVPGCNNGFHVEIAWKECNNSIRNDLAVLNKNTSKIAYYCRIISDFESGADSHLVTAARNDLQHSRQLALTENKRWSYTNGRKAFRVSVMAYVSCTTGVNCNIFGYISRGEMVPEVITTLLNLSKTGLIAREGSRQLQTH